MGHGRKREDVAVPRFISDDELTLPWSLYPAAKKIKSNQLEECSNE